MAPDAGIVRQMRDRQLRLARICARNGVTLKAISLDSGIPYSTIRSYLPGEKDAEPHIMPVSALAALFGVLPDEWLSILFEPEGKIIGDAQPTDHDPIDALVAARDAIDHQINSMRMKR